MPDYIQRKTTAQINALARSFKKTFKQAGNKAVSDWEDYYAEYADEDAELEKQYKAGDITKKEWTAGRVALMGAGIIAGGALVKSITGYITNAGKSASNQINSKLDDVFTLAHDRSGYEIEEQARIRTAFDVVSKSALEVYKRNEQPFSMAKWAQGKASKYYSGKVHTVIKHGLEAGWSVDDIARSLRDICNMGDRSALRTARTLINGAENAGRQYAYNQASEMGLKLVKEWVATVDDRTRDSHALIDGEVVDIDEDFSNGLEYPGDSSGDDDEVINCRCAMVSHVQGFDRGSDVDYRESESYQEWRAEREARAGAEE